MFDPETPEEQQEGVFTDFWKDVASQAKENLG